MRRRRGCWWRRRRSGGGGALALLDEAAFRFDFSQYTDVDNMVDVNGGWGPLDVQFTLIETAEFTDDGLRCTRTDIDAVARLIIDGSEGPMVFGPAGLTMCSVDEVPAGTHALAPGFVQNVVVQCNHSGDGAPAIFYGWTLNSVGDVDVYNATLQDGPPDTNNLAISGTIPLSTLDNLVGGVIVTVIVLDVDAAELRVRCVSPAGDDSHATAFAYSPSDFEQAAPDVVDYLDIGRLNRRPTSSTYIETLGWNRAFTPDEVDALIAHFTA